MVADHVPVVEPRHGRGVEGLPDLPHQISREGVCFLTIQKLLLPRSSRHSMRMPLYGTQRCTVEQTLAHKQLPGIGVLGGLPSWSFFRNYAGFFRKLPGTLPANYERLSLSLSAIHMMLRTRLIPVLAHSIVSRFCFGVPGVSGSSAISMTSRKALMS